MSGFTEREVPTLLPDPYPVTIVTSNGSDYEYARRHTTLEAPLDVGSLATGRLAILGTQTSPSFYKSIDIVVGIASGVTQHTSVHSEPYLFTGTSTLNNTRLDNAWHFRADPFTGTQGIGSTWGVVDEFGFAFSSPVLANNSYGFYYGSPGIAVTTGDWGVFIDDNVSNYFKDLVLVGDCTSIGVGAATEPEPILQVLDGSSLKKGFYVENTSGMGIRPDTRYRLYVDDNGCTEACRFAGITHVTDITNSSSGSSGALIVDGGVGIAKKLYVVEGVDSSNTTTGTVIVDGGVGISKKLYTGDKLTVTSGGYDVTGNSKVTGNLQITGALTKGSGTFDIQHPLEENKRLRHSFVESPRYDNIYRNKVQLQNGKAVINLDIDCVSPGGQMMSPGTWEKLNRNPDIFLQNNTGWDRLKGKIDGSTLIIECENPESTDLISWMVVAERQDQFIIDSSMSDDEGRLILEYTP